MRTLLSCIALVASLVLAAPPAGAGSDGRIGVYADLTATQTQVTFSIGVARTLYVVATLDGQTADGVTGAEFRITGLPADWLVFATPNPAANIVLGNPFREQGGVHRANLAFQSCQSNAERRVLLYTALVVAQSTVPPGELRVEGGLPPGNASFPTQLLTRCDAPQFTKVPVDGGVFQFDVRAPQDLYYSEQPGYDSQRGVKPIRGQPGDLFHFRVVYAASGPPAAGSPRLELDANGDGDALDAGEGAFTMAAADLDSTILDGKAYRYDVALGEPPAGRYHYRFSATDAQGMPVGGAATAWLDSLFVSAALPNLVVRGADIRVLPPNPLVGARAGIVVPIENRSEQPVSSVRVRITNVHGSMIDERFLSVLGPRSTTEIAVNWEFGDSGFQPVVVRVDPANLIAETDETDNVASHGVYANTGAAGQFTITGLPPLASLPPVAPFGLVGAAAYASSLVPQTPVRGAQVSVRPSWQAPFTTWTGAEGGFAADLVAPAVPGTHRVAFVVADGAHTDSAVVNVQVTPLGGQQPPHAPNLVPHLEVALGAGCPAAEALVSWSVENRGDRDSAPTTARLLADGVTAVAEVVVGAVPAGATVALDAIQVPIAGARLHAFTMHVDPAAALRELREDDNAATAGVRLPVACLDLALDRARFTSGRFCTDPAVPMAVRVANRGCVTSAPARVACFEGATELASAPLGALAPGQLVEVQFALALARVCHALRFELDPEGAAGPDCDPAGDALAAAVCIEECEPMPQPDPPNFRIVACDIGASNLRPSAGEALRFAAWVENSGPGVATGPVLVSFRLDGVLIGGQTVAASPTEIGARVLVQAPATWPADFAPHVLVVEVDPNGQPEWAAFDNMAQRVLPYELHPLPIAACQPVSPAMFSACSVCRSETFQIHAIVENSGLFDCDSVVVEFRDQSDADRALGSVVAHDVRGGGGACAIAPTAVTLATALADAGTHSLAAVVDAAGTWPEADETNNRHTRDLIVNACMSGGDLVAAVQLPAGTDPQPGQTIQAVEVRVSNIGQETAFDVQARLRLDGATLCDLEFGDLLAGQANTIVCTTPWVVDSTFCQRLEACADPDNRVGEPNESNNCATIAVASQDVDLAILPELIDVTPPNPVAGQQVFIEVGLYNFDAEEASCRLQAEYELFPNIWVTIADVPLHLPPGSILIPVAAAFVFTPPIVPAGLRFALQDICPVDRNSLNNVVLGSLPWFDAPGTPVVVRDLEVASHPDGVHIRWHAEPGAAAFAFDRRLSGEAAWERLAETIAAAATGTAAYEFVDRTAEPGARLEYRLVARLADGVEEVLGTVTVEHGAASIAALQLYPVRPQPFRPGGAFEFSLPQAGAIELCVFDAAGRRVRILRHGPQAAGRHAVPWDCRDDTGRRVPAGVYFCRFAGAAFEQTRRIVLVH
jgi:hypothetical protein